MLALFQVQLEPHTCQHLLQLLQHLGREASTHQNEIIRIADYLDSEKVKDTPCFIDQLIYQMQVDIRQ